MNFLKTWGIAGAIMAVLAFANWFQFQQMQQARADYGQVIAALGQSETALEHLRELRAHETWVMTEREEQLQNLAGTSRTLEKQLREAMKHARDNEINLDVVLPDGIADALCLRWRAASGLDSGGAGAAPGADPAKGYPAAAVCDGWRGRLTLGDVVEWAGLLLDHAGAERLDKAALRSWTQQSAP